MSGFNHLRNDGSAHMVDVTGKQVTARQATAIGRVTCAPATMASLRDGSVPKGDVLAVARIAGVAAAKRTPELLPLAHVIGVHGCEIDLQLLDDGVLIQATVRAADRTGVEMEALTAVTVAALSIVIWGVQLVIFLMGFLAFEFYLPAAALFVLVLITSLGMAVPSSPAYIGTYQISVIIALAVFGVERDAAFGYSIVIHAMQALPITLFGFIFAWKSHMSIRQLSRIDPGARRQLL